MAVVVELIVRGVVPSGHLDALIKSFPEGTRVEALAYSSPGHYGLRVHAEDLTIEQSLSTLRTIEEGFNV